MKPRRVARYLFQGEGGFYARMAVPAPLRTIIGKKEFWAAVHASKDAGAVRKLPAIVAAMQAQIDAARAEFNAGRIQASPPRRGRSLTPRQLAVAHYDAQNQFDIELRNSDHRYTHGFADGDYVAALRSVISGAADSQGILETLGRIIRKFESAGNLSAQFGTPEWTEAARALAVAELEALARTAERDESDFTGQPTNPSLGVFLGAPTPYHTVLRNIWLASCLR